MENIIATSKTTDLIVQVTYKDYFIIKGFVLVGDQYNHIGKQDYWSTNTFNISKNSYDNRPNIKTSK